MLILCAGGGKYCAKWEQLSAFSYQLVGRWLWVCAPFDPGRSGVYED